jgi:predicted PurR-regulated permease PerM
MTEANPSAFGGAARLTLVLAALVVVVAGMKAAAAILVPFLLAVFLAVITAPYFLGLQQRGMSAAAALLVMTLVLLAVGLLGATLVRSTLIGFSNNLDVYQQQLGERTAGLVEMLSGYGIQMPDDALADVLSPNAAMGYLGGVVATLSGLLSQGFLILLVTIFILLEAAILPAKVRGLPGLGDETYHRLERIVEDVRRYMSMKTLISLLTGALVMVMAWAMGIDFALLLGLLAFVLNYVPNVGSIIAGIPGVLLAFIQFGLGTAAAAAVGYVAINMVVGNWLEPRVMGRGLGLSPLVVLLSMIFWGWVLGPVGMLLSVPLTMAAKIALEASEETKWIALLLGSGPAGEATAS